MATEGLSVICAGLGSIEENENGDRIGYQKGDFCLDNLKDLLLFLRRDDPQTRDVFMQVCKWNITCKDLIPLIEHFEDDHVLVLNAVKVLVFLTMPIDPSSADIPQQLEYMWMIKLAISHSDIVPVILSLLEGALENLQCEGLKEGDWKLVQLVVTLFRNVLAVQDVSLFQSSGSSTHFLQYRDMFLELLFRENVMDVILVLTQYIGSCEHIRHDNLLILDTFHYVFMNQDPEMIVHSRIPTSEEDMNSTGIDLRSIMEEEEKIKAIRSQHNFNRHSQFSGTFTKAGMGGSKILFKGDLVSRSSNASNMPMGNQRGILKKEAWDHVSLPSKKNQILEYLHDFLSQLLSGGYNDLMQSIRGDIERDGPDIHGRDVAVFFRVAEFVTSFQYHKMSISMPAKEIDSTDDFSEKSEDNTLFNGDICGPIATSMNWGMFQLVASKWRLTFDGLKETNDYYYLSSAGALMKTMVRMLDLILKIAPKDSKEPRTTRIILYKLFYDQTQEGLTHFLFTLIKTFDSHKQSKSDLGNVVEIMHVVFRLMEKLQAHGTLRVSKKSTKGRKKKKSLKDFSVMNGETDNPIHEKPLDSGTSPIETISSSPQKVDIGSIDTIDPLCHTPGTSSLEKAPASTDKAQSLGSSDGDSATGDECSDDEKPVMRREIDFDVSSLVSSLAHSEILRNLCWLLKFYKVNPLPINHYIICMFRRICDDLDLSPILYQLSFLTTFHSILRELKSHPSKDYENIYVFLTNFVRRMLRKMKNQPLLFVEILFHKTRRECYEINSNALAEEIESLKKETHKLECDYDNVNIKSVDDLKGFSKNIGDALGDDEADVVISYDIGQQSENISEDEGNKAFKTRKKNLLLNDDIRQGVKDLYEKYKDCENCKDLISENLDIEGGISTLQVSRVLNELGIKLPRKKRVSANHKMQLGCNDSTLELKNIINDDSLPNKTMHSRKRIKAFSEEQEMMIKTLYEEYKGNKRCSFLIAKALDADGAFSTNQVSKKLVQLGLQPPRNVSNTKKMPTNGIMNNSAVGGGRDSDYDYDDDEPLLSQIKRCKANRRKTSLNSKVVVVGETIPDSNCDDDEPLFTLMKRRKEAKVVKMEEMSGAENITSTVEDPLGSPRLEEEEEAGWGEGSGAARPCGRRRMVLCSDDDD